MYEKVKGQCIGCKQMYLASHAARHLVNCKDVQKFLHAQSPSGPGYILKISFVYDPYVYWMYITIPLGEKLSFLDKFLRNIWLECCGHLSLFRIHDISYWSDPTPEIDVSSMTRKISNIFYPGLVFTYEYDFGSTTALEITVIDQLDACASKEITILIRNEDPVFECENCRKKSKYICGICHETVCEKCMPAHECIKTEGDDYMMLPLVNSPRTGVCAYEG